MCLGAGALTGPYIPASAALIVQASGLQAPTLDGTPARSQPTSTVPVGAPTVVAANLQLACATNPVTYYL